MKWIIVMLTGLMAAAVSLPARSTTEPTGASLAFTSRDPMVLRARKLMADGKFSKAEALLASSNQPDAQETLEIIHRTRLEYSLDETNLFARVKKVIPSATPAEVNRWAHDSHIRYRMIDGKKFYFSGEPENIFIFNAEARRRRDEAGAGKPPNPWKLTDNLQAIVDEAERTGKTEVVPIKHTVTHTITVHPGASGLKVGALVRAWLPFPQEYRQQQDVKLLQALPEPHVIAPADAPQRTIYFERRITDLKQPLQFQVVFQYTCYGYYPKLELDKVQPLPPDWDGADLGERPPHIVFTPAMRRQVVKIIGHETNALARARLIFHWVSANIPWNAEDEYCIIPGFAEKGFSARRGDCGVQNTVFVTLCRIAGIPARWQSGYETKPFPGWGMHDWSEIYVAPWGWIPTDASYGVQKSKDPRIADFFCGHQDSYRLIVNLDWGRDLFPPKTSLRSEPADFQRGEVEIDGKNLYYDQWTVNTIVHRDPGPNSLVRSED